MIDTRSGMPEGATPVRAKDELAVCVEGVSMVFNIANQKLNSLKEYFISFMRREFVFKEFRALEDISFRVNAGDVFGIIGTNGSGKSTLLKIIAGVLEPTNGSVETHGRISPLIELGAGFDYELTARENIYLNGALLGYSKSFIDEHFDEIVAFSEVEDFMEMPLKNFSSGMVARIAFAIATVMVPDILIVDEVLSVGDFAFKQKCERRIQELIEDHATTVLIVSHSDNQIEELCDNALWLDRGHMKMIGPARDVCQAYRLLGGGIDDPDVEKTLLDALALPDEKKELPTETIAMKDRYEMAVELARKSLGEKRVDHVVIASGSQFDTRVLAAAYANAAGAPIVLASPKALTPALTAFLYEHRPEVVTIVDRTEAGTSFEFDIAAQVSSLIGADVEMLQAESFEGLSGMLYERGARSGIWGDVTLAGKPSECIAMLTAASLVNDRHPFIYMYNEEALKDSRLYADESSLRDAELISFSEEDSIIDLESPVDIGYRYAKMNYETVEALMPKCDDLGVVFASSRNLSHAIAALQFAISQKSCIVLFDSADPHNKAKALTRFLRWEIEPSRMTFVGPDSDLSAVDKKILRKSLCAGRR